MAPEDRRKRFEALSRYSWSRSPDGFWRRVKFGVVYRIHGSVASRLPLEDLIHSLAYPEKVWSVKRLL